MVNKISKCQICEKFFSSKRELKDHINENHRISDHMAVTPSEAERIADDISSSNDGILSTSVMDRNGNIIAAKSKESFKETFGVNLKMEDNYGGTLAVATLSIVNEVREIFGEPQAIITIYQDCKLMLLPIPSYHLLVGLVLQRSVNEQDKIANEIERLLAHILRSQ
jgi:hypothetical protein